MYNILLYLTTRMFLYQQLKILDLIANGSISISRSVTQSPKNPKLHLLIDAMPWNNRDLLPLIKTFKIQYIPKFQYRKDKMLLIKKALHPLIKGFWTREQKKLLFSHYGESFFLTVYNQFPN